MRRLTGAFDKDFEADVVPLLRPVAIIATGAFWVLNFFRIALAGSVAGAVIAGIVTVLVLLGGGAALIAEPRMRSSFASFMVSGALVVVLLAGLVTMGTVKGAKKGKPVKLGPAVAKLALESGNFYFKPKAGGPVPAGVIELDVSNVSGGHTIVFEDPSVILENKIQMMNTGTVAAKVKFAKAGTYVYFCNIPGHRQSGMEGTVKVDAAPSTTTAAPTSSTAPAGTAVTTAAGAGR